MLAPTPRLFHIRPTIAAVVVTNIIAGARVPSWLPAATLHREQRPFSVGSSACDCCCRLACSGPYQGQRYSTHHLPSADMAPPVTSSRSHPMRTSPARSTLYRAHPLKPIPLLLCALAPRLPNPAITIAPSLARPLQPASPSFACPSRQLSSSHSHKRRRTATASSSTSAPTSTASHTATAPQPSSSSTSTFPTSSVRPPPGPANPRPTSGLGQVVASASKFVRVEVHALLPDDAPTPEGWRPPLQPHSHGPSGPCGPSVGSSRCDGGGGPLDMEPGCSGADAGSEPLTGLAPGVRGGSGTGSSGQGTGGEPQSTSREATAPETAGNSDPTAPHPTASEPAPHPTASEPAPAPPAPAPAPAAPLLLPAGFPSPVLLCSIRALLRKLRVDVAVGDVVRVGCIDWVHGQGVVGEVLPRSSRLTDPNVANVDHVLLVFALDQPPFEELQVSRFLVAAEAAGLPFSLLLNKADLVPGEVRERRVEQCRSWGYEPVVLSCESGEGVEQVAGVLQGHISAVAGPSGAGKSSLINSLRLGRHRPDLSPSPAPSTDPRVGASADDTDPLFPPASSASSLDDQDAWAVAETTEEGQEMQAGEEEQEQEFLAVGALSRIGRGMHTTTAVRLLRLLGGGWLADTPGFGQPTLDGISSQQLGSCFPEIAALVSERPCRFSDCRHVAEPGCSVGAAGLERYPHYLRFLQEIQEREAGDLKLIQRAKAEREGFTKTKSARGGGERHEARLDSKKHRRASRQSSKQAGRWEEGMERE